MTKPNDLPLFAPVDIGLDAPSWDDLKANDTATALTATTREDHH